VAVKAEVTVAFLAEKPGLAIAPGMFFAGGTVVAGIGVAPEDVLGGEPEATGYGASDIGLFAPRVSRGIHKGSRGALLIIGGSSNYRGAPALSALAALRAGCGLVALAVPESLVAGAGTLLPEAIFIPLPEKNGHISFDGLGAALRPYFEKFDAVVAGPGLGRSPDAGRAVEFLHGECPVPMLVDADALRFGCKFRRSDVVATPHAGEAAHILGVSPEDVDKRRLESCAALAAKFGTAVLKGPHTLISDGRERRIVLEGGPELAVPGSGDVLSGIIGAYLASGMAPMDAATLGAVVHGVSGALSAGGNPSGLLAREIADGITDVLYKA
jgi:NAD(P)H-hydrate epimerase